MLSLLLLLPGMPRRHSRRRSRPLCRISQRYRSPSSCSSPPLLLRSLSTFSNSSQLLSNQLLNSRLQSRLLQICQWSRSR